MGGYSPSSRGSSDSHLSVRSVSQSQYRIGGGGTVLAAEDLVTVICQYGQFNSHRMGGYSSSSRGSSDSHLSVRSVPQS